MVDRIKCAELGLAPMDHPLQTTAGSAAEGPERAEIVALLKQHQSFASLDDSHLHQIAEMSRVDVLASGEILFAQGDLGDFAHLVLSGEVAIEVETQWGQVRVATMGSGDMVGEIAAFATMPRTATVLALGSTRLLRLEHGVIAGLLAEHPEAAMAVIAALGRHLQNLNETIAILTQAASALAAGEFRPAMLETLKHEASRFRHFAGVFEGMAGEITQKRMLSQEMETAAEIQRSFLPKRLDLGRFVGRCDIHASMIPAKQVGGDFYDYFLVGDDNLAFAIGDVSGKGVPAAIFMSLSRTVLKTIALTGGEPGEILAKMNRMLVEENTEAMFVTLFFGCLNLETGTLSYSSGGHEEVFLLPKGGQPEQLEHLGPAIGLFEGATFESRSRQIETGDLILLATDGVTEAFDPAQAVFGFDRLTEILKDNDAGDAEGLVKRILVAVDEFADGAQRSDDTTCLALRLHDHR